MTRVRVILFAVLLVVLAGSPPGRAASDDIVLYSSDVTVISGLWTRASSTTGAGGLKMTSPDTGFAAIDTPIAAPMHYFEVTFDAPAATTYQLWLRLRAAADSKWNDSVWVQFDDAIDAGGNPLWRIGTTDGLLVNLEDCIGCGESSWGWQDNASWLGQTARVRFPTTGRHTIRIQLREDGVDIDQIVLSPSTYLNVAPGAVRNDTTIVPKPSATPTITLFREPFLQQVTTSSAIVVWATRENGVADVSYAQGASASLVAAATTRFVPSAVTGLSDYYQHEATVTGLAASTAYSYVPRVNGVAVSSGGTFTTAPSNGTGTVRFISFGDSGIGSPEQRQLAAQMEGESFDLALHTGDVVYGDDQTSGPGGYPQLQAWFFDIYRNWLHSHPIFPAIGNHDDEANFAAPFRDVFVLPTNGATSDYPDDAERFYSFDYGAAHVVVLDTELAFQDPGRRQAQLAWLRNDLAGTTQPWKIAVFHRSPYSAGAEHGSDLEVRSEFGPIFEAYGVRLALSGHEHDYERTILIQQTTSGTPVQYIVSGGGGARLYAAGSDWWTAVSRSVYHYLRGSISSCRITIDAVALGGAVFDSTTLDRCAAPPPPPPSSTPYNDIAASVPGVVQAENFDEGGQDVAYHDASAGNAGGQYRVSDVDIEATADTGGGYNVGWMGASEWLAYSVDVASSGSYTLEARVAAAGPGGTFHVEVNGANVTGPLVVPNTGGWQSWTSIVRAGIPLGAGRQVLRFVVDADGPTGIFGNLNFLRFTSDAASGGSSAFGGTPWAVPGVIQAEDFDVGGEGVAYHDASAGNDGDSYRPGDVDIEPSADAGGGFNVGWMTASEWLAYSVDVAATRTYTLEARVAAYGPGGTFHIEANGVDVTGPLTIPNTGWWQTWTSVFKTNVALTAGRQTLRVVLDTNSPNGIFGNLNYLRFQ